MYNNGNRPHRIKEIFGALKLVLYDAFLENIFIAGLKPLKPLSLSQETINYLKDHNVEDVKYSRKNYVEMEAMKGGTADMAYGTILGSIASIITHNPYAILIGIATGLTLGSAVRGYLSYHYWKTWQQRELD